MPPKTGTRPYNADDHRRAFEIYVESRSYNVVSTKIGCMLVTATRWSQEDYPCPYGCPFHGWVRLLKERSETIKAQFDPAEVVPLLSPQAMAESVSGALKARFSNEEICKIVFSNVERLQHWELLYAKVYYDLTGIQLDVPNIAISDLRGESRRAFTEGLHITTFAEGVKMLAHIEDKIENLRTSLDIPRHDEAPTKDTPQKLSISELRRLKVNVETAPPEEVVQLISNGTSQASNS